MKKNKINKNLDLDLIELFQVAWNGKWIISTIMVVSLIISVGYYKKKNDAQLNYFTSEIEFLKINNQEAELYSNYNFIISYKATTGEIRPQEFFQINREYLFELYLEIIQDKEVFQEAIKNSEMINKKNYPSEKEFNTAINEKVSSIIIYVPDIIKKKYFENDKINLNWRINFFHNNEAEWMSVFEEANKLTNEKVIEIIKTGFKHSLNHEKQKFLQKVEDIDLEIKDLIYRSKEESKIKLKHLKQQAEIARVLNIENHSPKYLGDEDLYYLKGYIAIEKEIEFINENLNDNNYDKYQSSIINLQIRKKNLLNDDSLNVIEREFNSTPVVIGSKDFTAAKIKYEPAQYVKHGLISPKVTAFVILMSLAVGLVFLLVVRQIRST